MKLKFSFLLLAVLCSLILSLSEAKHLDGENYPGLKKTIFYEPLGTDRIRLTGNSSNPNGGLVKIFRNNSWGYVCDDDWDIKDANVVCRQLGYNRGAAKFVIASLFGEAKNALYLMDDVKCAGDEKQLQKCSYNIDHNCDKNEAAGVICNLNTGCEENWMAGPSGCYRFFSGTTSRYGAETKCRSINGHLVKIETQEENDFLNSVLRTRKEKYYWLTDGIKNQNWIWKTDRKPISTSFWFPGWEPQSQFPKPSNNTSKRCIALATAFKYDSSKYLTEYFFWDNVDCNKVSDFICETEKTTSTAECYTGNGIDYRGSISLTVSGTPCLKWTRSKKINPSTHPNVGLGDHNYCRNADGDSRPWCWVDFLRNLFGYCDIPKCSDDTETTTASEVTQSTTKATTTTVHTTSLIAVRQLVCEYCPKKNVCNETILCSPAEPDKNTHCYASWKNGTDGVESVMKGCWLGYESCYNKMECVASEATANVYFCCCEGEMCNQNFSYRALPTPTEAATTEGSINCPKDEMYCTSSDSCISLAWKCNNEKDCSGGEDEMNCDYKLDLFEKKAITFTIKKDPIEVYMIPLETCARMCVNHRKFACKALRYEILCKLYDTNEVTISFSPISGTYYVLKAVIVELVGDISELSGRIEITRGGVKGSVCDDDFDDLDATVICRMMGHSFGVVIDNTFGEGEGTIWLDDLSCYGSEDELEMCPNLAWGEHNCTHEEDVAIKCFKELDTPVSSTTSITPTSSPNQSDYKLDLFEKKAIIFTIKKDPIEVYMIPLETCARMCVNHRKFACKALHYDIICSLYDTNEVTISFFLISGTYYVLKAVKVELVGGISELSGRIEITRGGVKGSVCDDDFDDLDATVICRMMGNSFGEVIDNTFGEGEGTIWLDDLSCYGSEDELEMCPKLAWGEHDCTHKEDVAIKCFKELDTPVSSTTSITPTSSPNQSVTCGKRPIKLKSPRIAAGHEVKYGTFPWQARILKVRFWGILHQCGATIIHEFWLLTAAHCLNKKVKKDTMLVRTGDLNGKIWDTYEQSFDAEYWIQHPSYNSHTYDYDVALIKLKPDKKGNGIIFNDYVQPVCLPPDNLSNSPGTRCEISGWGSTGQISPSLLKAATIPLLSQRICKTVYKEITPRMFCAGYLEGGIDTCQGDSGGPLVCNINGVYTLVGITSWGNGCAQPNYPGVYTNVANLKPWITATLSKYS